MDMDSDPAAGKLPSDSVGRSRIQSILLIGAFCVVLAGWGASEMRNFANPLNQDTAPLPRQKRNAPFIKSANAVVDKMIEMADITDKDLVYDLGCGDGRIVITAAVQRGCHGVGFDIEPQRITEATENAQEHGVTELVKFEQQDVFKVDLSQADVVVMYLLPWMLKDLIPQFDRCRPGTRIVSHDFPIEGVEVERKAEVMTEDNDRHFVNFYVTPLKKLPEKEKRKRKL